MSTNLFILRTSTPRSKIFHRALANFVPLNPIHLEISSTQSSISRDCTCSMYPAPPPQPGVDNGALLQTSMSEQGSKMNRIPKKEPMAAKQSKRARKQRKVIADTVSCPPPEKRVFGPPTPTTMCWDNAVVQQRYLEIVAPVSVHENMYNKWHVGNPTAPLWKDLKFVERAHWAQFYFDFEKLALKDCVEIDNAARQAKTREEHVKFYKKMFKRTFVPEKEKVEENPKRQKVYDVNGTMIGYLNREPDAVEKANSSKDEVVWGSVKKNGSGVHIKQYGPDNAIPTRGPWRPVKTLRPATNNNIIDPTLRGPPSMVTPPANVKKIRPSLRGSRSMVAPFANYGMVHSSPLNSPSMGTPPADDSMIDPALRSLGASPVATSPASIPNVSDSNLTPRKREDSQFSSPSPRGQRPLPVFAQSPNPFKVSHPSPQHTYNKWAQRPKPKPLALPANPFQYGIQTWPRYRGFYGEPAQHKQTSPFQRPQAAVPRPEFSSQLPHQTQPSPESMVQDATKELDSDKIRLGAYGYMLATAPRDHYQSPYFSGGTKKE